MPNFISPRAEGERMDMAEVMLERSRQEVEFRLKHNALAGIEICDEFQAVIMLYNYYSRQVASDIASLSDQNNYAKFSADYKIVMGFIGLLHTTDAGREAFALVLDRLASRKMVSV